MPLLSDKDISALLDNGKLVVEGDKSVVRQCAYPFHAGKIFVGGGAQNKIDWTSSGGALPDFAIPPGGLVWIRMKEKISLPSNVCALWWQTHTLSKLGIMLINTSIVDPGYVGYVTGLFINFGRAPVSIQPETVMARLMFFQTATDVTTPYANTLTDSDYDFQVNNLANAGPASFLMIGELAAHLTEEKAKAVKSLAEEGVKIADGLELKTLALTKQLSDAKNDLTKAKDDLVSDLQKNAPTYLLRSFAWAGAGFAILVALTLCVPWLQQWTRPNLDEYIAESVDKHLLTSFEMPATLVPDAVKDLNKRLDDLNTKVDKIAPTQKSK
jgi:deoxycytidine triphosphate deaminase